jgi:hypothetical protein
MSKIKDKVIKTEKINWQNLKDLQPTNFKNPFYKKIVKENNLKYKGI